MLTARAPAGSYEYASSTSSTDFPIATIAAPSDRALGLVPSAARPFTLVMVRVVPLIDFGSPFSRIADVGLGVGLGEPEGSSLALGSTDGSSEGSIDADGDGARDGLADGIATGPAGIRSIVRAATAPMTSNA